MEEYKYGNLWIFQVKLVKGDQKGPHKHEFDHVHQVLNGSAIITVSDGDGVFMFNKEVTAGQFIKVPKEHYHSIQALEDYHGNCLHAIRNSNNEVIETEFIDGLTEDTILFEPNKDH